MGGERGGARSKWLERDDRVVKNAESADELVKKGGASRRMGRLSMPSQTDRANRNKDRNDGQERRAGMTHRKDT